MVRLLLHNALRVDEACRAGRHRPRRGFRPPGAARGPQGRAAWETRAGTRRLPPDRPDPLADRHPPSLPAAFRKPAPRSQAGGSGGSEWRGSLRRDQCP